MNRARMLHAVALSLAAGGFAGAGETRDERAQSNDDIRIAVQKICPISGQTLGAHGAPVKVKVGKEHVFLCCQGCLTKKVSSAHWATIHANFAKAQGKCPVMDRPLPKNPKWTIVGGQIVYVCCPPCIEKIGSDPDKYLRKLSTLYTASLRTQESRR